MVSNYEGCSIRDRGWVALCADLFPHRGLFLFNFLWFLCQNLSVLGVMWRKE